METNRGLKKPLQKNQTLNRLTWMVEGIGRLTCVFKISWMTARNQFHDLSTNGLH